MAKKHHTRIFLSYWDQLVRYSTRTDAAEACIQIYAMSNVTQIFFYPEKLLSRLLLKSYRSAHSDTKLTCSDAVKLMKRR